MGGNDSRRSPGFLPGVRTLLVLVLSVLTGITAGVLAYLGGQPWSMAVLAGGGSVAAAVTFFDRFIPTRR